jgi:hypothetical protein
MHFNYLAAFPIPSALLPDKLRTLLMPVGLSPQQVVEIAAMTEFDPHGPDTEHLHLLMAVVVGEEAGPIAVMDEAGQGVVEYSVPAGDKKGCSANFSPSMSGHDYMVAAWGDGSFYTFNLAEKVWMTLGLTPRCVGNDQQRLIYDDLGLPEFGVVEGEVSSEYYGKSERNINWRMSNEYLRKYLWLRGARGFRAFYYQCLLSDTPELRNLMGGKSHVDLRPLEDTVWYELDIREHKKGLLIQVWATVEAVTCELCPEQSADGIMWPDEKEPMSYNRANALLSGHDVYLDDKFLQKYEQSSFYDSRPYNYFGTWRSDPSYKGQWSFSDCERIGRNLICVPMRELYKPKPDREILHAHNFALSKAEIAHFGEEAEHIVSKTARLLDQILDLGDNLSKLGASVGLQKTAVELVNFSRTEIAANGSMTYKNLCRLAQVAPLDMTQQLFLARCKSLHEIWQRVPNGFLKSLLEKAGCPRIVIKDLASIKLLQSLFNIVQELNLQEEKVDAFSSAIEKEYWKRRNAALAPLFLNNDLRIADAHDSVESCIETLQSLGFDTANLNEGYGSALDFLMNGVVDALAAINMAIDSLLKR